MLCLKNIKSIAKAGGLNTVYCRKKIKLFKNCQMLLSNILDTKRVSDIFKCLKKNNKTDIKNIKI